MKIFSVSLLLVFLLVACAENKNKNRSINDSPTTNSNTKTVVNKVDELLGQKEYEKAIELVCLDVEDSKKVTQSIKELEKIEKAMVEDTDWVIPAETPSNEELEKDLDNLNKTLNEMEPDKQEALKQLIKYRKLVKSIRKLINNKKDEMKNVEKELSDINKKIETAVTDDQANHWKLKKKIKEDKISSLEVEIKSQEDLFDIADKAKKELEVVIRAYKQAKEDRSKSFSKYMYIRIMRSIQADADPIEYRNIIQKYLNVTDIKSRIIAISE